jgi:hypothetical protein
VIGSTHQSGLSPHERQRPSCIVYINNISFYKAHPSKLESYQVRNVVSSSVIDTAIDLTLEGQRDDIRGRQDRHHLLAR